jgi:glutathione S-transferase
VLVDQGQVIYETAAIGLHLADAYPDAGLAPPPGSPERADYLKWMVHLANTPQAEFRAWFYPHEFTTDPAGVAAVKASAGLRLAGIFERIEAQLGDGPWLLGRRFSAADLYLLMMVRWGRTLPRPARDLPNLGAHAARVLARPAVQATFEAEGLPAPFI